MRISDLEGSLAFAQEQIKERDERLIECQQIIAEDIAWGISEGLGRARTSWEAAHAARVRSHDEEINLLKAEVLKSKPDVEDKEHRVDTTSTTVGKRRSPNAASIPRQKAWKPKS